MSLPSRQTAFDHRPAMQWDVAEAFGVVQSRPGRGGKPRWYIELWRYGRIYSAHGSPFKSRARAQAVLDDIRVQVARGTPKRVAVDAWRPTSSAAFRVELWLGRWLVYMREREKAGDRSPNYLRELERWNGHGTGGHFRWWDGRSIRALSASQLMDWDRWLCQRGLSPKSRRNVLGGFRSFLTWLRRVDQLQTIPIFPEVPTDEHAPTIISPATQARILEAIPWERRGAFYAARMGLRPGEIRAADIHDVRDVDGVPGLLVSRAIKGPNANAPIRGTKARNAAWVPMDEDLQRWVEWRLAQDDGADLARKRTLFPNPTARRPGKRWIANALREEWNRAAQSVGVEVRMYEGTKHSSASAWLEAGASIDSIRLMLRHSDRRSTERYAKLGNASLVSMVRRQSSASPVPNGGE